MRTDPDEQLTPEWREADELAQRLFAQSFPLGQWRGRRTNRPYYRRKAKAILAAARTGGKQ